MLTRERLKELLRYDPDTGAFTRLRSRRTDRIGKEAGHIDEIGYVRVTVDGRDYRASRLAWFYMTGEWPKHEIDHRDLDRKNNCWDNLREATHSQNGCNTRVRSDSKSAVKGVRARGGKWLAQLTYQGRSRHLGVFSTKEEAAAAYARAAHEQHGEFARV